VSQVLTMKENKSGDPNETRYDLSVVIVSFNTREVLRKCLQTLEIEAAQLSLEVLVVDNGSRDGSVEMVNANFPDVRVIHAGQNLGFAAANNLMFPVGQGKYIVLLNSDAFLRPGALQKALEHMEREPRTGLGGGRLIGEDGAWQPSARMFPSVFNDLLSLTGLAHRFKQSRFFGRADRTWADPMEETDTDWVPGAFSIIRASVLKEIGGFDEAFFLYYEEVDLCRRIKAAGYTIRYWPDVVVVHLGGESSKSMLNATRSSSGAQLTLWRLRSGYLYYRKHHGSMAWMSMAVESTWHLVRFARNRIWRRPGSEEKAVDSHVTVTLVRQAWKDTQGGRTSPPKPW
jgi:GT2 family glycosyltransferase